MVASNWHASKKLCEDRLHAFLHNLRQTGNISASARAVNISPWLAHDWKNRSMEEVCHPDLLVDVGGEEPVPFYKAWDEARQEYADLVLSEVHRRAVQGVPEPIYYQGQRAYERDEDGEVIRDKDGKPIPAAITKYSDSLLSMLAKGTNREMFGDQVKMDAKVEGGLIAVPLRSETAEEWAERHKDVRAPDRADEG